MEDRKIYQAKLVYNDLRNPGLVIPHVEYSRPYPSIVQAKSYLTSMINGRKWLRIPNQDFEIEFAGVIVSSQWILAAEKVDGKWSDLL